MKPKPLMNNPDKTANLQTNATARTNVPNEVKMWIDNKASIPLALDLQAFNKTKHIVHGTKLNDGRTTKTANHQSPSDYLTRPGLNRSARRACFCACCTATCASTASPCAACSSAWPRSMWKESLAKDEKLVPHPGQLCSAI